MAATESGNGAVRDVDAHEAARLVDSGAFLLDVRELWEWDAGRATRASHIPLGDLAQRAGELPSDTTIVVTCRVGGRSLAASTALAGAGYDAVNLAGGMLAWEAAGLAVVDGAGAPGTVL